VFQYRATISPASGTETRFTRNVAAAFCPFAPTWQVSDRIGERQTARISKPSSRIPSISQTSSLPTFSAIYAFGESLSDAGNLSLLTAATGSEPVSPPYFREDYGSVSGNIFSNGPTWVQNLSIALGLGTLKPSLIGGTDFAFGGAETGTTPQNAGDVPIKAVSLPAQADAFHTAVPNPSATALYTLSIGSNDVLDILANPGLTTQQQTTDVNDAVANEISFVKQLVSDGAMNLLVLDVPDLGKTPDVTQGMAKGTNTPSAALTA
jgi:phospholipase/lecithinase/hemolysin